MVHTTILVKALGRKWFNKAATIVLTGLATVCQWAVAAPFQNLNFDLANTNNISRDFTRSAFAGPTAELLPGWQLFQNNQLLTNVYLDLEPFIERPDVTLMSHPVDGFGTGYWIRFALWTNDFVFSLKQIGDVPVNANKLTFNGEPYVVRMNGIPLVPLPESNSTTSAFDISAFSGQNVTLEFFPFRRFVSLRPINLDNILFIPEPSSVSLAFFTGVLFAGRWFFSKFRRRT